MPIKRLPTFVDPALLAALSDLDLDWGHKIEDNELLFSYTLEAQETGVVDITLQEAYAVEHLRRAKMKLLEDLAAVRRTKEAKGPNGLGGDAQTTMNLMGAAVLADLDPTLAHIDWEVSRGVFMPLPAAFLKALFVAGGRYRQACFTNVKELTLEIQSVALATTDLDGLSLALTEMAQIDINSGWPTVPMLDPANY